MEQWNGDGETVWWKSGTVLWNSGTVMVEQCWWKGETVTVEQWNGDGETVWWNSGTVTVEQCGRTLEQ